MDAPLEVCRIFNEVLAIMTMTSKCYKRLVWTLIHVKKQCLLACVWKMINTRATLESCTHVQCLAAYVVIFTPIWIISFLFYYFKIAQTRTASNMCSQMTTMHILHVRRWTEIIIVVLTPTTNHGPWTIAMIWMIPVTFCYVYHFSHNEDVRRRRFVGALQTTNMSNILTKMDASSLVNVISWAKKVRWTT